MTSFSILCPGLTATPLIPFAGRAQAMKPATDPMLQREHLGAVKLGLSD